MSSLEENPREFKLFFYYPSQEYLNLLEEYENIEYIENISFQDAFDVNDQRECIVVYHVNK